ncbi:MULTISPECIES: YbdD/YjiX family protein [unclassified Herbaspirillum]|uniref:YbdD/YjiX family protein n=1 Tax=unclassified Herbaspirillum TaxID=2624150 RepID=UPI00114E74AA|nr:MULTISPECIES: CstA-like transporter-associated (seleno)protein [unclassified Herbaspirillum]MBB5392842.1 uncharacterized short protein YbdD (DUF466 family) [Herbaspirillum sp. SJZ102]TQK04511.1 uncharacterized short protein YbdD (DUF466 family) [Herbaspirillum sp. SJZ130]TQK09704.1 uncharacterized short protein YbdD (DUF466 family) [Herbaspirillum sp. SJZ106]
MKISGALAQLLAWRRQAGRTLNLMVGMPEYDNYVAHVKHAHPDQCAMSYEEFFRERQEARYGGKGRVGRCC